MKAKKFHLRRSVQGFPPGREGLTNVQIELVGAFVKIIPLSLLVPMDAIDSIEYAEEAQETKPAPAKKTQGRKAKAPTKKRKAEDKPPVRTTKSVRRESE